MLRKQHNAKNAFNFSTHIELREYTGLRARNIHDLLSVIKTAPDSVIYYHTHLFLQLHQFLSPEPPNAFAYWVTNVLGESALGEKLGSVDICQFQTIRQLREKLVEVIEGHLFSAKDIRNAPQGAEFDFIKVRTAIMPTPYQAFNLKELVEGIKKVTIRSIDFHMFNARLRLQRGTNDFSFWIETSLGYPDLAAKLEKFDPYTYTLEGLRKYLTDTITVSPEWELNYGKK